MIVALYLLLFNPITTGMCVFPPFMLHAKLIHLLRSFAYVNNECVCTTNMSMYIRDDNVAYLSGYPIIIYSLWLAIC